MTHPLAVANILANMHMDHQSLMAAMLHDVIEDTGVDKEALGKQFGKPVAELVDGVSKLTQITFEDKAVAQAENFQKMVLAMSRDIRVIIVKLADRLHNMRTLGALRPEKKRRIARETLEIYARVASRLGINTIRVELEDLSFQALHPMRSERIKRAVASARGQRRASIRQIQNSLQKSLDDEGLKGSVIGRQKHLLSIYRKMRDQRKSFAEIMDVFGFRIITQDVDTCYRILGVVHNLYKPVPGRFKDYIAIPKANGYQSLHTTLFGTGGMPIEVQIRTREMEAMANNGIAAHWLYKAGQTEHPIAEAATRPGVGQGTARDAAPCRGFARIHRARQKRPLPRRYLRVHPQGRHHGAAPGCDGNRLRLQRAYRYRQQLHRLSHRSSPGTALHPPGERPDPGDHHRARRTPQPGVAQRGGHRQGTLGDSPRPQAPAAHRGRPARTTPAQQGPGHLRDQPRGVAFRAPGSPVGGERPGRRRGIADVHRLGTRVAHVVARRLVDFQHGDHMPAPTARNQVQGPIMISGAEGMVIKFARCCHPLPGDPVIGHLSAGKGIVVHRADCRNLAELRSDPDKLFALSWSDQIDEDFPVPLRLEVESRRGLVAELASLITDADANIERIDIEERDARLSIVSLTLAVRDRVHLARIIKRLRNLSHVGKITRLSN